MEYTVVIDNAALVPDEFCNMEGSIPAWLWFSIEKALHKATMEISPSSMEQAREAYSEMGRCVGLKRVPSSERIRAALQKPCPRCGPDGWETLYDEETGKSGRRICPGCHGTKTASVPGCRLEPRGETVIVK